LFPSAKILLMNRIFTPLLLSCTIYHLSALPAAAVLPSTVPVGNSGNALDQEYFGEQSGAVAYDYEIGTYEVTNDQYAEFLNAKAIVGDPLILWSPSMGSNARGGITRNLSPTSYSVKPNMGNKPVNFVNWYDAIRFVNWLHNGQGNGDTETGAYTLLGGGFFPTNGDSITRNPGATWVLPNENEWYKAAYHQPAAQGGDSDDYWLYPTRSNTAPTIATADSVGSISNPGANVANYKFGADWNGQDGNVTTVGSAGALSTSFYGTFDQGGNIEEWSETQVPVSNRRLRGGAWNTFSGVGDLLAASTHPSLDENVESHSIGFRVALVPEPSTLVLAAMGLVGWVLSLRYRKGTLGRPLERLHR